MASPLVTRSAAGETLIERLTASFYAWETRGRGWSEWPDRVRLEPPFVPFPGHLIPGPPLPDDGRKPTAVSAFIERLLGHDAPPPPSLPEEEMLEEPRPTPDGDRSSCHELSLFVPADMRTTVDSATQFLLSVRGAQLPLGFEVVGTPETLALQLVAREPDVPLVERQLGSLFPEAVSTPSEGSLEHAWRAAGPRTAIVEFGLSREFMLPLARVRRLDPDPLSPILGALSELETGECGVLQVLFEPAREEWAESVLRAVTDGQGRPFFLDAPELTKLAADKVSHPSYGVVLRLGIRSTTETGLRALGRAVAGALAQFGAPHGNELIPLAGEISPGLLERDLLERRSHRTGMLLSSEELVSFVHLPSPAVRVPKLARDAPRTKEAPDEVKGEGVAVGENRHRDESTPVRLPLPARLRHTHLVGASGTGKTTLLTELILQDIEAGSGLAVLDPHGDLVEEILARIGEEHSERIVLIDPGDEEYVVGFNPLQAHSEAERQLLASDLVGVFRRLSTSWGDQMHSVFANAILAFLESERGGTLLDLRRFLVERSFRERFLETVGDSEIQYFWQHEFPLLAGRPQAPILTRLDAFLRPKVLRAMVSARESRLDLQAAVGARSVILVKLAQGLIGEENAALLGSFLVSKLHQVALARQILSPEAREPFFLYLDEFQEFVTPSLAGLLSGARKFGVGLVLAHQSLGQVKARSPEVLDAVLSNAYTQISFRVGEADARTLERGLSFFEARDLQSLGIGEAIMRVGRADQDFTVKVPPLPALPREDADRRRDAHRSASRARYAHRRSDTPSGEGVAKPSDASLSFSQEPESAAPPPSHPTPPPATSREQPRSAKKIRPPEAPELDKSTLDYLHSVAADPFLAVRERNRALDLSAWKGQRIKSSLLRAGLVREVAINPGGRGRKFKLLELTEHGRALLAEYKIVPSSGHGRGGVAHQWWVRTVAGWLEARGLTPVIEDASSGVRVDLSFSFEGDAIAVEVEMTEGHAVENVRKDLAAGFAHVVCLVDNPGAVERIRAKLATELADGSASVQMGRVADFEAVLGPLVGSLEISSSLGDPNQNQERRRPRRRTAAPPPRGTPQEEPGYRVVEPGVLSTPAAADYLALSPATLETLRSRGGGPPFVKLGRRVVYRREDLDGWLAERRRSSTSDESTE